MFASIFECADGFPQWRKVGEKGPGSLKIRWPFLTLLALMIRCIGRGCWRDKRLIAAGTNWLLEWADGLPARATEEGHWVSAERDTTCKAFDRQHKPEGLTAPSDESILCVFTYHRRGSAPITYVYASSMGMCRACQGCCSVNGCDIRRQQDEARAMRDGRDAREKQDGRDSKFEVQGSKF